MGGLGPGERPVVHAGLVPLQPLFHFGVAFAVCCGELQIALNQMSSSNELYMHSAGNVQSSFLTAPGLCNKCGVPQVLEESVSEEL